MIVRSRCALSIAAIALIAAGAPDEARPAPGNPPSIRWDAGDGPSPASVEVVGLDPENLAALARSAWDPDRWADLFSVRVVPATGPPGDEPPPILGSYRVAGTALQFVPRYPLEPGLRHRARFRPSRLPVPRGVSGSEVTSEFTRPAPPAPSPTSVVRVDPAGDRLPENLLKFYLHFSAPMSRGEVYSRVRLLDASGRPLTVPFLELGEELWNDAGTRLTLLLDPGRIKRGLRPREELGPILESGRGYTLVIDRAWPDARGYPLREAVRRTFRAGPADETQPDPKTWTVAAPPAGTLEPVALGFPEPLDRAMLDRVLEVVDSEGRHVPGRVDVDADATRWRFRPEQPWRAGVFRIEVDTALEDLAGNSIARPFEVDVLRPITRRVETETIAVPFTIR